MQFLAGPDYRAMNEFLALRFVSQDSILIRYTNMDTPKSILQIHIWARECDTGIWYAIGIVEGSNFCTHMLVNHITTVAHELTLIVIKPMASFINVLGNDNDGWHDHQYNCYETKNCFRCKCHFGYNRWLESPGRARRMIQCP
jgi:hypothetical protein